MSGSKFDMPQPLQAGAIAYRFGADDHDTIHAAKLKAVQDFAFLRSKWMGNAVENDLDSGDHKHRWAMFVNGVTDDLQQARIEAAHAGINIADIDAADKAGSTGVSWDQEPAHRRLGRLEQLSEQLYHAQYRATEHLEQIKNLTHQLETAHAAIDALGDHLTRNETTLRELFVDLVDAGWQGPAPTTDPGSRPPLASLNRLRQVNATLVVANLIDTADPTQDPDRQLADGRRISAAIDTALPHTGSPTHEGEPAPLESADTIDPTVEPDSGVEP